MAALEGRFFEITMNTHSMTEGRILLIASHLEKNKELLNSTKRQTTAQPTTTTPETLRWCCFFCPGLGHLTPMFTFWMDEFEEEEEASARQTGHASQLMRNNPRCRSQYILIIVGNIM